METYVVRIYRHEKNKPRRIVGIVEEIGGGKEKKAFTSYDELWSILKSLKGEIGESKKREVSVVTTYNAERRNDIRSKTQIPGSVVFQDQKVKVNIVDVSRNGLGITTDEKIPLAVGNIVDFRVRDCALRAEVRWVDHTSSLASITAGFQTTNKRLNLNKVM